MLDNVPRDNVGLIVSPRRSTEEARGSRVKRAVPRQDLRDTVPRPGYAHRGLMGSRDKVLIMFLTSKPRAGALTRNLIIRPWLRLRGISRVDIMIRWLCGHISPTAPSRRYSRWGDRRAVRTDGNNVGGPSHAAYTDCTTASRSNSPNYKIIILRLAPPGNTRDQARPPLSSRPHSPCSSCSPLLSPYSPFPPLVPSCRLPICPVLVDPRWLSDKTKTCALASWCARTHDSEQIAGSVSLNLMFSPKRIKTVLIISKISR